MLKDVLYICALSLTLTLCVFAAEENQQVPAAPQVAVQVPSDEVQVKSSVPASEEATPEALSCKSKKKNIKNNLLACCGEEDEETVDEAAEEQKVAGCPCKGKTKGKEGSLFAQAEEEVQIKAASPVDEEKEELACIKCGKKNHFATAEESNAEAAVIDPIEIKEEVQAA